MEINTFKTGFEIKLCKRDLFDPIVCGEKAYSSELI